MYFCIQSSGRPSESPEMSDNNSNNLQFYTKYLIRYEYFLKMPTKNVIIIVKGAMANSMIFISLYIYIHSEFISWQQTVIKVSHKKLINLKFKLQIINADVRAVSHHLICH